MQRLPLPGPGSMSQASNAKSHHSSDFALRDILERWAGSDDTLKVVMMAKAEEDRLKQEVMRLEIRRTEMDMLKEAIRAGIQPHMIPLLFNASHMHGQSIYTPVSPSHGPGNASSRTNFPPPPPPQIPSYPKLSGQSSPRFLPKLDTSNLSSSHLSTAQTAGALGSVERRTTNGNNEDVPQSAPAGVAGSDQESGALFFHHWQPPSSQQGGQMIAPDSAARAALNETPGSPTPRKRKLQQYHIINTQASPSAASRKSPSRGHARHRSEASGLHGRFSDPYMPPATNTSFSRISHDRESPAPLAPSTTQNPTSHEIDLARKRKRQEAETAPSDVSAASTIPEEPSKSEQ